MASLKEMLDSFVADGVLTRDEHDEFIAAVSADGKIDDEERAQISRMFQLIRDGKLTVVDTERERFAEMKRREAAAAAPTPAADVKS
ncbi:MAG: hypothetical protein U0136_06265 [Bdellovibrionota bacterium]